MLKWVRRRNTIDENPAFKVGDVVNESKLDWRTTYDDKHTKKAQKEKLKW